MSFKRSYLPDNQPAIVINPLTGRPVKYGTRLFKKLVNEGIFNMNGDVLVKIVKIQDDTENKVQNDDNDNIENDDNDNIENDDNIEDNIEDNMHSYLPDIEDNDSDENQDDSDEYNFYTL